MLLDDFLQSSVQILLLLLQELLLLRIQEWGRTVRHEPRGGDEEWTAEIRTREARHGKMSHSKKHPVVTGLRQIRNLVGSNTSSRVQH